MNRENVHHVGGYGGARIDGTAGESWQIAPPDGIWTVYLCKPGGSAPIRVAQCYSYEHALDVTAAYRARGWFRWQESVDGVSEEQARALRDLAIQIAAVRQAPDTNAGPHERDALAEMAHIGAALIDQGFDVDAVTAHAIDADVGAAEDHKVATASWGYDAGDESDEGLF